MRIGIYLGDFSPDVGGGYTFQEEVFRAFVLQSSFPQHEYIVMCNEMSLNRSEECNALGIEMHFTKNNRFDNLKESLKVYSPLLRKLMGVGPVERACKVLGLDCLWYVGGGVFEATDTPYIATVWDLQHRMTPWFPEMSVGGTWDARELSYVRFLQRASIIITGTEVGRQELALNYGVAANRTRQLPHPTPTFVSRERALGTGILEKYDLKGAYLFYPAQFWAHKNHIGLLHAMVILRDKYKVQLPLVFAGAEKGNIKFVKKIVDSLNLTGQVIFTGFVTQPELVELYRGAKLMVYPSFCGPENLPPLEAFALGCPVVAADVPGAREQLGEAAHLFDPLDYKDIAEKINELLTNESMRNNLVSKGINRANAWTVNNFTEKMIEIFDEFSLYRQCWPSGK